MRARLLLPSSEEMDDIDDYKLSIGRSCQLSVVSQ